MADKQGLQSTTGAIKNPATSTTQQTTVSPNKGTTSQTTLQADSTNKANTENTIVPQGTKTPHTEAAHVQPDNHADGHTDINAHPEKITRVQPQSTNDAHNDLDSIKQQVKDQKELLESTEEKIRGQQDHLLDLKRKVEARQQLLTKLREIGEKSKQETAEFYFHQLNKQSDEMAVKDKQIAIHLEKIKDLEKLLSMARSQAQEANRLNIQLRAREEEVDLVRQEKESMTREHQQEREKSDFQRKNLLDELNSVKDTLKKTQSDLAEAQKKTVEANKSREAMQAKIEDVMKAKEKAASESKTEADRAE